MVFRNKFKVGYTWMRIMPPPPGDLEHQEMKVYDKLAYADIEECKRMALRMAGYAVEQPPAVAAETPAMAQKIDTTIRAGERKIRL